jgi:stage II sporulation protein D
VARLLPSPLVCRSLLVGLASLLLSASAGSARSTAPVCSASCTVAPPGSGPLFVLDGHGWGHGVGLSQYGAYGFAQHGWTYQQILAHYFPGTTLGTASLKRIRVLLADAKPSLTIASAADFRVTDGTGQVHRLAAGSYTFGPTLTLDSTTLTAPLTFAPGSAPLRLGRLYRGTIAVSVIGGKLRAVNALPLEQYLYGVVPAEMPYRWTPAALQAQAVVARSFALSTRKLNQPFDVYSDTRSQVYLGISAERPSTTAAVDATAGRVLLYGGNVARTYFFSTSGGETEDAVDVWPQAAAPYLVSVPDPFDAISPYHDWGPVLFTGSKLAKTFHVGGVVDDVRTVLGTSGRVTTLQLLGPATELDVKGTAARTALGLRSTWFDVGMLALTRTPPAGPVQPGATVELSGTARGLLGVEVEQRPLGGSWESLQTLEPDATGAFTLTVGPTTTTDYRLANASVAGPPLRVVVAASR